MSKVALVIIYNHQYNKNIEKLEAVYGSRFSHIFNLVPFYSGDKPNVIAVYESSYCFQGYVAQGLNNFFSPEFDHYFFIGDDLMVNPVINENNYSLHLNLDAKTSFIPRLSGIADDKRYWANNITALLYNRHSPGVEAEQQLPPNEEILLKLQQFGISTAPLEFYQLWNTPKTTGEKIGLLWKNPRFLSRYLLKQLSGKKYQLSFPMVRSYSDIFVVDASTIKLFCHYCGVFAATRLFVELALPTALVMAAENIKTENDIQLSGKALWTTADHKILEPYHFNLDELLDNFPEGHLYLHPVKLSKWKRK